jgi:long-chain-acyl-CoA dehydrogenase
MLAHRRVYNEEHAIFRDAVRRFIADQIAPNFARWEQQGIVDGEYWVQGGQRGLLCPQVPTEFGGPACDFSRVSHSRCPPSWQVLQQGD